MIAKVLFVLGVLSAAYAQKTPVYVYYESLCPDSMAFITKQLYPAMKELKDHVSLELIPFGKSTWNTQGSDTIFNCHHGPEECYGNKIHACAISHIQVDSFQTEHTRETLIVDYITCLMSGGFRDQPYALYARKCAEDTHVKKFESIEQCANSTEGSKLLEEMGEKTFKLENPLKSVPTITIRETYDAQIQKQALNDLPSAICNNLPKPIPAVCRAHSGASTISGGIIAGILAIIISIFRFI
ncbi:hypothetical protein PVAND_000813 [Polypedilum vanderplanki]|uniref:Gamma-interferon inducible lysosomal thiol reductase n=1 Tax=Polypedilum vanderplanki TaxID=319348 RepID=A0A9J6BLP3_POLVA|nr:hypothetical protein PVAND_000813 [Polypedilum vanderplanki]